MIALNAIAIAVVVSSLQTSSAPEADVEAHIRPLFALDGASATELHDRYLMVLRRGDDGAWMIASLAWAPR